MEDIRMNSLQTPFRYDYVGSFLRPERFSLKPLSGLTVLEVKYDAFLPDLVRMAVQIPNRRAAACSKYALCRRYD